MTRYGKLYYQIEEKPMLRAVKRTVLLEMIERENTTESGLIIKGGDERTPEARVVSVGPQCDCELKVGDRVVVDWSRVGKIVDGDKTLYVTDQTNIMAVFED